MLSSKADSVSYAFGRDIGSSLKSLEIADWNKDLIGKAIISALDGQNSLIAEDELRVVIQNAVNEARELKEKENLAKEQAFLLKMLRKRQ